MVSLAHLQMNQHIITMRRRKVTTIHIASSTMEMLSCNADVCGPLQSAVTNQLFDVDHLQNNVSVREDFWANSIQRDIWCLESLSEFLNRWILQKVVLCSDAGPNVGGGGLRKSHPIVLMRTKYHLGGALASLAWLSSRAYAWFGTLVHWLNISSLGSATEQFQAHVRPTNTTKMQP